MDREESKKIIEDFIRNQLKQNSDDEYDNTKYIELSTETNAYFIIYKKNRESSIYVKPKNGNNNFSESIDRILDYYIDNNTDHHADKSYVVPISDYIFKNRNTLNLNNENITHLKKIYSEAINMKTKNIMLYGAPGVGKTHNYKRLISMIENTSNEKTIFDSISKNETTNDFDNSIFEDIKKEKRIEFVTFHQSYSYEDFIEGFRPQDNGNIKLEDGIFKIICEEAKENLENSKKDINELNIKSIFDKFVDNLIEKNDFILTENVDITNIDDKAFYYTSKSQKMANVKIPFKDILELINQNIEEQKNISLLENISGTTRRRPTYSYSIYKKFLDYKKQYGIKEEQIIKEKELEKNFYIVIDEINRGNISKIFGELITLIEEDKRDDYEVTLPYSKDKFKIPSNLYIIATMNSTDKSIATIDIALRRRFTFLKMKPNLDLVENQEAKKLMEDLNKHISKTINEDYALGHSYFMKIENEENLAFVKEYKIKPLLEEYFYGDEENYKKAENILYKKEIE